MKNISLILLLLVSIKNYSQMAVTDVTANQILATQLATSSEQLVQLQKNYDLLKAAEEKYQKINSIYNLIDKLSDMITK